MPDAFLLISYGAPVLRAEIRPFLEKIAAGRPLPEERLLAAVARYERLGMETGSLSPLPEECRQIVTGLACEFSRRSPQPVVYWGNLFWNPLLEETVAEMARDGRQEAVVFATSAFESPLSTGRYEAALTAACASVARQGLVPPHFRWIVPCGSKAAYHEAVADRIFEAISLLELEPGFEPLLEMPRTRILFTAHSLPKAETLRSPYISQLLQACRAVMTLLEPPATLNAEERAMLFYPDSWELVYQSRSGRPEEDWLGPDIGERLVEMAREGHFSTAFVVPIGFFCENMETVYDLDLEAADCCASLGLRYVRARAAGASPRLLHFIADTAMNEAIET